MRSLPGWADFTVTVLTMSCAILSLQLAFGTLRAYMGEGALVWTLGGATLALGALLALLVRRYRSSAEAVGAAVSGTAVVALAFTICLVRLIAGS